MKLVCEAHDDRPSVKMCLLMLHSSAHHAGNRFHFKLLLTSIPILVLQTIDKLNISLLRLLWFDTLVVDLLPGAALCFLL